MRKYLDILKKGNSVGSVLMTILVASSLRILGPLAMNGLKNVLGATGTDRFNSLIILQVIIMSSIIIISALQVKLRIVASNKLTNTIKPMVYDKIVNMSVADLNRFSISKLTTIVNTDTGSIISFPIEIVGMVAGLISTIAIMVATDVTLSLITLIGAVPLGIAIVKLKKRASEMATQKFENRTKINIAISRLEGYLTIKSFGKESYETNRFTNAITDFMNIWSKRRWEIYKPIAITNVVDMIMALSIIIYVTQRYTDVTQMVANGLLFYSLQENVYNNILYIPDLVDAITEMMVGVENITEVLETKAEEDGTVTIDEFEGSIEFKDVAFSYENSKSTLYNVNMTIPKGTHVGIYGPSGGGKTSLLNLMNRFYRVDSGEILIDGVNINKITNKSLRKIIGNVNQEIFIFSDMSIKDNIKYGIDCSDEDVIRAAKMANAHEFITKLENGYDSIVGNNGVLLSGGERQRIAIARLFLLDPPILLLDEATSKLDNRSERLIKESLQKLSSGKTVISIAHRLNTIQDCDMLVGIKNHTIYEYGTADYVKNAGKLWRELATVNCD